MGASGWSYVTAYHGDVAVALRELRERVFGDGDYYWWDESGDYEPRPGSVEEVWASEGRWDSGTHSILDIDRAVGTADPPDWASSADHGTVRPLAADRVRLLFGTDHPSRAQFEALTVDYAHPRHRAFIGAVTMRWTGLYVLLYENGAPTRVGFWGFSGD